MNTKGTPYCSNCQIKLANDSEYQSHYRSDIHRYNIRRRQLNLDPVSAEVFQKKFLESQSNTSCSSSQTQVYSCAICKKNFLSSGTYSQHLNSAKHKQTVKESHKSPEKNEKSNVEILPEKCLFCDVTSIDIQSSYNHMKLDHGFFIREEESLVDRTGLIDYLRLMIEKQYYCLTCPSQFASSEGAKQHMLDKGHCFMPHEQYDQLCHFYDFTDKITKLLGIISVQDLTEESFEQILEFESMSSSRISDFEIANLTNEQLARKQKFHHYLELISQHKAKLLPNGELQLPNGKILGHRCYKKIYDQNHVVPLPEKNNHLSIAQQKQFELQSGSEQDISC